MRLQSYLNKLKGRSITVIGAGISNTPLIEALLRSGNQVTVRDKQTFEQLGADARKFKEMGAGFKLGSDYLDDISEDIIFRTPALMPHHRSLSEAVARGAMLTSEMEVFFELCPCKIIGITGSDGKTTTTAIIAKMLENAGKKVHIGGNIGVPLLCRVDDMRADDFAVAELSSFQLITMKKSPETAVITNISPNHLDVHNDLHEYIKAKQNIYLHQNSSDRLVLNADNNITMRFTETAAAWDVQLFSVRKQIVNGVYIDYKGNILLARAASDSDRKPSKPQPVMHVTDIKLHGVHNVSNYLAAAAALGGVIPAGAMKETACSFKGVPHRIEPVRELHGVRYYNDSIATSPSRTIAGLRSFKEKVILIAGGKDKGLSFKQLGYEINEHAKKLILTGEASQQIFDAVVNAENFDGGIDIMRCDEFEDTVFKASKAAEQDDIVLLSPACTSFDMFKNFEERGNLFKELVNNL